MAVPSFSSSEVSIASAPWLLGAHGPVGAWCSWAWPLHHVTSPAICSLCVAGGSCHLSEPPFPSLWTAGAETGLVSAVPHVCCRPWCVVGPGD